APPPGSLKLPGSLLLDPDYLVRVRARFPGEVVVIGPNDGEGDGPIPSPSVRRPLRPGDPVKRNQLLAVVWRQDLGEKRSELGDGRSGLWLDQEALRQLQELQTKSAAPERSVREAERNVKAGQIAVERIRRTLRSWRLSEEEIEAVEQEAHRYTRSPDPGDR